MSKVFKRGASTPEMNMTPLIDVTFQLIIFFMLVNNIIAEEAVEMLVPELANPQTRELGEGDRVTVNVAPLSMDLADRRPAPLNLPGEASFVQIGQVQYALEDLEGIRASLSEARARNAEVEIVLRADAALYYRSVAPVMEAISAAQISSVNLVALLPNDGSSAQPPPPALDVP